MSVAFGQSVQQCEAAFSLKFLCREPAQVTKFVTEGDRGVTRIGRPPSSRLAYDNARHTPMPKPPTSHQSGHETPHLWHNLISANSART